MIETPATPLYEMLISCMRNQAGYFFVAKDMHYTKPALDHDDQLSRYETLGLIISDKPSAIKTCSFIGHFRLSPYLKHFRSGAAFLPATTFNIVIDLYKFDMRLRNLTLSKIEQIETSIKALLSDSLSLKIDPFWYLEKSVYRPTEADKIIGGIKDAIQDEKNKSPCLQHFYSKYTSSPFPPSWMIIESLSFGKIDKIYRALKRTYSHPIAQKLNVNAELLGSWLRSLSNLRNLCAHHHRIWNRSFPFMPQIPNKFVTTAANLEGNKFIIRCQIINYILAQLDTSNDWKESIIDLINSYSPQAAADMGLKNGNLSSFSWWK